MMDKLVDYIKSSHAQPILVGNSQKLNEGWKEIAASAAIIPALVASSPSDALAAKHKSTISITNAEKQIDRNRLLDALMHVESSGGINKEDRYERGVEKNLRFRFNKLHNNLKSAIKKYGFKKVSTSYGPWQILASTAYDLGFTGNPEDLRNKEVSSIFVNKYISVLISSNKTKTIRDVISAYNAGLGKIGTNNNYVEKVLSFYNKGV